MLKINTIEQMYAGEIAIEADWAFVRDCFTTGISTIDEDDKYILVMFECRICGESYLGAYPIEADDPSCMECRDCEHMTAEPVTYNTVVLV